MSKLQLLTTPAPNTPATLEQEQLAASKLASARARKAKQADALDDATPALATLPAIEGAVLTPAIEGAVLMPPDDVEVDTPVATPVDPTASWPKDELGNPVSPKLAAMLADRARESAAQDRASTVEHRVVTDAEWAEAQRVYTAAEAHVHNLSAELAGMPGRIEDAIGTGDYDALKGLKARKAELPTEIEGARVAAAKVAITYHRLKADRLRVPFLTAQTVSVESYEAFRQLEAKMSEDRYAAEDAREQYRDAQRQAGQAHRALEALMSEVAHG